MCSYVVSKISVGTIALNGWPTTSVAFQQFVEANSMDEFAGVKLLCVHTHGPGLFHTKDPVNKLEDLKGMKIRGGSRIVNDMLTRLGAEPVGMPVP